MNKIMVLGKNDGASLDAMRLRRGMPVRLKDGRTGKVRSLAGGDVHIDVDGPNIHLTGVVVKRATVRIKDGTVICDLAARLGPKVSIENGEVIVRLPDARMGTKTSKPNGEQSRVVDPGRARLEAEWRNAPED